MGMTSPFMSSFIDQLVKTTNQAHAKSEEESAAEVAQQREIYNHLLKSDDPEIQSLGLTGLMEKPQKDLFGKLKKSPNYEHVRSIIQQMHGPTPDAMNLLGGAPGQELQPPQAPMPPSIDPIRAQMDAATSAANAAPIPNTPEERAAWTAGQAPPPPGSAGMSAAAPMTGGGGQAATSGPPPNPQALLTGTPTPGGAAAGAPVAGAAAGHPADNVHPQGVQSYEQMLALSRMQDPLGLNPGHQKFRGLVQQMMMGGIPIEQGRRLIHDSMMPATVQAATIRAGATGQKATQGKPIPGSALAGQQDFLGNPINPSQQYIPTWQGGELNYMPYAAPVKAGRIVYDTKGNKKVAKLVDATTGETIKDDISEQEQALGAHVVNNPDGSQSLIQFSRMPGGSKGGGGTATATAPPGTPGKPAGIPLGKPASLTKLTGQEQQTIDSIHNVEPVIDRAMHAIEASGLQNSDSVGDWLNQRYKGALYKLGFDPGEQQSMLIQSLAFAKLPVFKAYAAGSRAVAMLDKVEEHIPNYQHDTPKQAYQKLKEWQQLLADAKGSIANAPRTISDVQKEVGGPPAPGTSGVHAGQKVGRFTVEEE